MSTAARLLAEAKQTSSSGQQPAVSSAVCGKQGDYRSELPDVTDQSFLVLAPLPGDGQFVLLPVARQSASLPDAGRMYFRCGIIYLLPLSRRYLVTHCWFVLLCLIAT